MLNEKKNSKGYIFYDSININFWDNDIIEMENRLVICQSSGQEGSMTEVCDYKRTAWPILIV